MKHSAYLIPEYQENHVFFHNLIEIRAYRKTENQSKEIFTYLNMKDARRIQKVLNFMDANQVESMGHSAWHIDNNILTPCPQCHHNN